jgi:hypothetical protein
MYWCTAPNAVVISGKSWHAFFGIARTSVCEFSVIS